MKVRWQGGPLDGCEDDLPEPRLVWISPDVTDPEMKVVVYRMYGGIYFYEWEATEQANDRIQARMN